MSARLLALGGSVAGVLGVAGGLMTPSSPTVGPLLLGGASAVVLTASIAVVIGPWCRRRARLRGTPARAPDVDVDPAVAEQPPPRRSRGPHVADLVIAGIAERKRLGLVRYGVPLQPGNGHDPLVDAYQEAIDLALYLRQAIEERRSARLAVPAGEFARCRRPSARRPCPVLPAPSACPGARAVGPRQLVTLGRSLVGSS